MRAIAGSDDIRWIQTVKISGSGYLVNGRYTVPDDHRNSDCRAVMQWIAMGNTPDPEFSEEELKEQEWEKVAEQKELELRATNVLCYADVWEALTPGQRAQVKSFRDSLRNIKKDNAVDPFNVVFPDIPDTIKNRMDVSEFKRKGETVKNEN